MSEYRHIASLRGPQGQRGPAGIGRHGALTEPTDIDEFREQDHIGFYVARATLLDGGPPISGNPLVTLEVMQGATNGVTQRATTQSEAWWRGAASSSEWGDWQRVPAAPVVATDRYTQIHDGQILYVVDQAHRAYDFHSFPTRMTRVPDGVGGVWNSNSDDSLLGGRGIRQGGGSHSTIVWSDTDGFADGDILTRQQRNVFGTTANSALVARASESGGSTSGYNAFIATIGGESRLAIGRRDAGSQTTIQSQAVNIEEGDACYIRFNLDGGLLRAKAWLATDREPDTWLLSVQDTTYSSGFIGFQSAAFSTAWDVLSVNESGGLAA